MHVQVGVRVEAAEVRRLLLVLGVVPRVVAVVVGGVQRLLEGLVRHGGRQLLQRALLRVDEAQGVAAGAAAAPLARVVRGGRRQRAGGVEALEAHGGGGCHLAGLDAEVQVLELLLLLLGALACIRWEVCIDVGGGSSQSDVFGRVCTHAMWSRSRHARERTLEGEGALQVGGRLLGVVMRAEAARAVGLLLLHQLVEEGGAGVHLERLGGREEEGLGAVDVDATGCGGVDGWVDWTA